MHPEKSAALEPRKAPCQQPECETSFGRDDRRLLRRGSEWFGTSGVLLLQKDSPGGVDLNNAFRRAGFEVGQPKRGKIRTMPERDVGVASCGSRRR